MFWRMLCSTLSLVEKLSGKIRHKHVSELHVIIVEKLPHRSMNHLCSWFAWQERIQYPAILTFLTALGEGSRTWETCRLKKIDRLMVCQKAGVAGPLLDYLKSHRRICVISPIPMFLSHSLPLWLMSPPDSIEAIRQ